MNEQNVNPTIIIKDLDRIKDREQWVKDEINEQLNKSQKNKWKKATIVLGLPGSGKSTIAEPLAKMRGSFIIDADEMKKRIPEFQQDENNICKVHEESVDLSNKMMDELMGSGYNMVIGKVGGHAPSIINLVKALKENGYDIDVIVNDVPFEESINRNIDRYKSGRSNRVVPLSTIFDSDSKIFDTFDQLMEMDEVNGGAIYSNDVLYGQKPQLLKTFKNKEGVLI